MDRPKSLLRRCYVLGAFSVAALAVMLLRSTRDVESLAADKMPATFPAFDVATVRALEIERTVQRDGKPAKESVRLERTGVATWSVASADGYPADAKKVEDFLKSLAGVRTRSTPTTNAAKFGEYAGADGYTDVRVFTDAEEPFLSFGLGSSNAEGMWSASFLRVDDPRAAGSKAGGAMAVGPEAPAAPGRVVVATGLDSWPNRTDVVTWVEPRLFAGLTESDVTKVTWAHAPKTFAGTLVRGTKGEKDADDPWTLEGDGGGAAKPDRAKQVVSAFVGLRLATLEGVATDAASAAKYGFDKPDVVATATGKPPKEGAPAPTYGIEVGGKVEGKGNWYVRRVTSAGTDKWVFSVADYDLAKFRDDPKDVLEKKPEPPAPPAPPAAMDGEPAMGADTAPPAMADAPPAMEEAPPAMGDAPPAMEGDAAPAPPAMEGDAAPMDGGAPPLPAPGAGEPPMGDPAPPK